MDLLAYWLKFVIFQRILVKHVDSTIKLMRLAIMKNLLHMYIYVSKWLLLEISKKLNIRSLWYKITSTHCSFHISHAKRYQRTKRIPSDVMLSIDRSWFSPHKLQIVWRYELRVILENTTNIVAITSNIVRKHWNVRFQFIPQVSICIGSKKVWALLPFKKIPGFIYVYGDLTVRYYQ